MGPLSPKRWTFPPVVPLNVGRRDGKAVTFEPAPIDPPRLAFLGVRACELAALGIQDRVFLGGPYTDEDYRARRRNALVIAVNCTTAASTCFCTSMGTGPEVRGGYDLVLTELDEGFVVRAGSPEGADLVARLPVRGADAGQMFRAAEAVGKVAATMGDPVPTAGLHDRLLAQFDSPRWATIAERCLSCANCTMVCPTCFCSAVTQRSDLDGDVSTSERVWDFCFTAGFAKVAGGNFRSRPRDRYRQWLTHKFATWVDQFGTFGCVGCGRCITWCPVGIDIRAELLADRPAARRPAGARAGPSPSRRRPARTPRPASSRSGPRPHDVTTLTLGDVDPAFLAGEFGQFAMVAVPAFPPVPISISRFGRDTIDLTIRAAGPATASIIGLGPRDEIGLRGPLGTSWPIERAMGHDVVIVTGGIGLAPLRPLIDGLLAQRDRFDAIRLYYGARTPADQLYREELRGWAARGDIEVHLTVDRPSDPTGPVPSGVVTHLFDQATWDGSRSLAFVCGPERMMEATVDALEGRGLAPRPHLRDARAPHGVRHRPVRALPDRPPVRVPGRSRLLARAARRHLRQGGHLMADRRRPTQAPRRHRQDGLVRRLPADAPRPRGRAAGARRPVRDRRVPGGELAPLRRSLRRPARGGVGQHARPGRGDRWSCAARPSSSSPSAPAPATAGSRRSATGPTTTRSAPPSTPTRSSSSRSPRPRPCPSTSRWTLELHGCPISPEQLREVLVSVAVGRRPQIREEAVCLECKRKGAVCVMVAQGMPCLGPVTQSGCGALCPTFGRGCYGCFGPREQANAASLARTFATGGREGEDVSRLFAGFTGWAPPFRAVIGEFGGPPGRRRPTAAAAGTTEGGR